MVMVSSPIKTSLTTSRTMRWRAVTLSVSAALRRRARNAVSVSARRRNAARAVVWFAVAQPRHALPQLFDRQESFLVGVEQSFDAFANMDQFPLQTLLMFFGAIRGARCCQPSLKFLLY